jgi:hypothetical protein
MVKIILMMIAHLIFSFEKHFNQKNINIPNKLSDNLDLFIRFICR